MSEQAKPCPFCGGKYVSLVDGSTFRWVKAECGTCGATSGEVRVRTIGFGDAEQWAEQSKIDAIAAWNTRAHGAKKGKA